MNMQGKKKIRLLLVEDDEDFGAALISRLTKRNFEVTTVTSAEEALAKLEEITVDVVVADIKLPGMGGMELLAQVRKLYNDLPVILLTGYGSLESAKKAVRLNATDYLLKPLETIDDLLNPVHKAVHSYRLFRENKQLIYTLQTKMDELGISERKYRDLFESASDIIYTVDSQGFITSVNKRMEQVTKYKKKELIGKPATKLIASVEDDLHEIKSQETLAGKALNMVEVKIATKNGKERVGEMGMRPIREDGKIVGMQCIVHDITERKKAEEEIRNYQKDLRSLASRLSLAEERERRRIATGLHDHIGHTLALSKMKVGELRKSTSSCPPDSLDEIQRLIEQAIEHTRSLTFELSPPVLYELGFEAAVEWLTEHLQEEHNVHFIFHDGKQPKPLDENMRVLLFSSMRELLVNVAKHAKARNVEVSLRRSGENLRITVKDDGIGFDMSKKNSYYSGMSGFGLFSIRERLQHLGGSLEVKSKPGQGTQATLIAPIMSAKEK